MAKSAVTAILCGASLFVLGMIPGLLAALTEGLRNFLDYFSPARGPSHRFQTDSFHSGEIWLVVGGGMMMILGLVVLLRN